MTGPPPESLKLRKPLRTLRSVSSLWSVPLSASPTSSAPSVLQSPQRPLQRLPQRQFLRRRIWFRMMDPPNVGRGVTVDDPVASTAMTTGVLRSTVSPVLLQRCWVEDRTVLASNVGRGAAEDGPVASTAMTTDALIHRCVEAQMR